MTRSYRAVIMLAAVFVLSITLTADRIPRFEDFPAFGTYQGRNAPLILTKDDAHFRTRLREAMKGPPNFAKHYILTAWGCGAGCLTSVVIDANTGRVYWTPHTICCWRLDMPDTFLPIEVRLDSRLIIFHGERDEKDGDDGDHYYEFKPGKFVHLRSVKGSTYPIR